MKTEVSSVPWRFDCDSPPIVCISDESGSFDNNYGSAPIVKQEYGENWTPSEVSNNNWEKVAGAEDMKCKIFQIITKLVDYKEYENIEETLCRVNLLLFGPPGCGKTFLSKIVTNDLGAEFVFIKTDELMKEFELKKCEFLENYQKAPNVVIFFDNFEDILKASDDLRRNIFSEINLMSQTMNIITIAATEKIFKVTPILEKHSFHQLVYLPLPDEKLREEMLRINIAKKSISKTADLQDWAKKMENFSYEDINKVCKVLQTTANSLSYTEIFAKSKMIASTKITSKQFMETIMCTSESLSAYEIDRYQEFSLALKELKSKQSAGTESLINHSGVQILSSVDFLLITNQFLRFQNDKLEKELMTERSKKRKLTKTLKRSKSRENTAVQELETFCKEKFEELIEKRFKIERVENEIREKLESFFNNSHTGD